MLTHKRKQGNNDVFDEATITLATDEGPAYSVLWPRDERLPEDMASEIALSLGVLSAQLVTLNRDAILESQVLGLEQTTARPGYLAHKNPSDHTIENRCDDNDIVIGVALTPGGSDEYARPLTQFQVVCAHRFKPKVPTVKP